MKEGAAGRKDGNTHISASLPNSHILPTTNQMIPNASSPLRAVESSRCQKQRQEPFNQVALDLQCTVRFNTYHYTCLHAQSSIQIIEKSDGQQIECHPQGRYHSVNPPLVDLTLDACMVIPVQSKNHHSCDNLLPPDAHQSKGVVNQSLCKTLEDVKQLVPTWGILTSRTTSKAKRALWTSRALKEVDH